MPCASDAEKIAQDWSSPSTPINKRDLQDFSSVVSNMRTHLLIAVHSNITEAI
jgi:hypothetical protein